MQFEYDNTPSPDHNAPSPLSEVKEVVRSKAKELGGVPSWLSLRRGDVWVVQGEPWSEVCSDVTLTRGVMLIRSKRV